VPAFALKLIAVSVMPMSLCENSRIQTERPAGMNCSNRGVARGKVLESEFRTDPNFDPLRAGRAMPLYCGLNRFKNERLCREH
jgi:hypothetical protein